MSSGWIIASVIIAVIVVPLVAGLLSGIDRKLTAHMQGRIGPPIIQPFYDIIKLLGKKPMVAGQAQLVFAWAFVGLTVTAVVLLALRQDLVLTLLVFFFGSVCLPLGALSVKSPYSQYGGHRELLQLLALEPILLLSAIPVSLKVGSFLIADIFAHGQPLLPSLWITFAVLLIPVALVMRKSPFDIAGSEHAHQELVRGVLTEYSGPYLALVEVGHWYAKIFVLSILGLFWVVGSLWWLSVIIALGGWFIVLIVDNVTSRLTWSWMVKFAWGCGITLITLNSVLIHLGWM